jgi:ribosomal protein S8E
MKTRDSAFKHEAKHRIKNMAKATGPVDIPDDLALDPRILHVGFKPPKKKAPKITEEDKKKREELNGALQDYRREQRDRDLSRREQKFKIEDFRTHHPNHHHLPEVVTGDEFNGMSDVRRALLLKHAGFQAIEIRLIPVMTIESVHKTIQEIPLLQGETRDEEDATIVSYMIDPALGFYVCYVFPKDGSGAVRFFYSCDCENIIKQDS